MFQKPLISAHISFSPVYADYFSSRFMPTGHHQQGIFRLASSKNELLAVRSRLENGEVVCVVTYYILNFFTFQFLLAPYLAELFIVQFEYLYVPNISRFQQAMQMYLPICSRYGFVIYHNRLFHFSTCMLNYAYFHLVILSSATLLHFNSLRWFLKNVQ